MNKASTGAHVDPAPYLLVAGAYRSGSTALFTYLSAHPQVAPARVKETGFFFPDAEDTGTNYRFGKDSLEDYASLFPRSAGPDAVRVEASPGYLFYGESARAINAALPNARIVVSLRQQVPWLVSWYKTLKALGIVASTIDFDEYIQLQVTDPRPWRERPNGMRAVDHGYYAGFVQDY